MSKTEIRASTVFPTAGPYVQAINVASGATIYTSGVLGRDVSGKLVDNGDAAAQARQCLENIRLLIEEAGGKLSDLVKLTVFISHPKHYEAMNQVRREVLKGIPFTSTVTVAALIDPHGLVEMDAVAVIPDR